MWKAPVIVGLSAALLFSTPSHAAPNKWLGTWKLELRGPAEKPETLIYSDAGGGAMRMESVEQKSVIVTRFDGKAAADQGAGAGKGNALAVKATSPTSYTWTFFLAGKPYVQGRNMLTPDLKAFTEVSWLVGKPADTVTLTYRRQ